MGMKLFSLHDIGANWRLMDGGFLQPSIPCVSVSPQIFENQLLTFVAFFLDRAVQNLSESLPSPQAALVTGRSQLKDTMCRSQAAPHMRASRAEMREVTAGFLIWPASYGLSIYHGYPTICACVLRLHQGTAQVCVREAAFSFDLGKLGLLRARPVQSISG